MTAPGVARAAHTRCALRAAGPRGRSGGRGRAPPEGAQNVLNLGESASEQQTDSSWSFPVRHRSRYLPSLVLDHVIEEHSLLPQH